MTKTNNIEMVTIPKEEWEALQKAADTITVPKEEVERLKKAKVESLGTDIQSSSKANEQLLANNSFYNRHFEKIWSGIAILAIGFVVVTKAHPATMIFFPLALAGVRLMLGLNILPPTWEGMSEQEQQALKKYFQVKPSKDWEPNREDWATDPTYSNFRGNIYYRNRN